MADYSKIAKKVGSFLEVDDWAQALLKETFLETKTK